MSSVIQLVDHLFEAVLKEDVGRVRSLLKVGADADRQVRSPMGGTLARELQITSVRHLARVLQQESTLRMFDAEVSPTLSRFSCVTKKSCLRFFLFVFLFVGANIAQ